MAAGQTMSFHDWIYSNLQMTAYDDLMKTTALQTSKSRWLGIERQWRKISLTPSDSEPYLFFYTKKGSWEIFLMYIILIYGDLQTQMINKHS